MADNRSQRTGVYELPSEPEIADLHREADRAVKLAIRTHTVATVIVYDPATQTADVAVDILTVIKDLNVRPSVVNPNPVHVQDPVVLKGIPVHWPQGSLGSYSTMPLLPGAKGMLHVSDRSLEAWKIGGIPTEPVAAWTHNLADSVFHPGDYTTPGLIPPTDQTAHVIEGPLIKLGYLALEPVLKGTTVAAAMTAYTAAVAAAGAVHAGVVPPTSITNGLFITALTAATATLAASIPTWPSLKTLTE